MSPQSTETPIRTRPVARVDAGKTVFQYVGTIDRQTIGDRLDALELSAHDRDVLVNAMSILVCSEREQGLAQLLFWCAICFGNWSAFKEIAGHWPIEGGTGRLIGAMSAESKAELRLSTPVAAVDDNGHEVIVTTRDGQRIRSRRAVVALPLNMLSEFSVTPALPRPVRAMGALSTLTVSTFSSGCTELPTPTFLQLEGGLLGRVDDMLVVRGVNVFPSALEGIVRRFAAIDEFQIEVFRRHQMDEVRLLVEVPDGAGERIAASVRETVRVELGIRVLGNDPYFKPLIETRGTRLFVNPGAAGPRRFHLHPSVKATLAQSGQAVLMRLPSGRGWRLHGLDASHNAIRIARENRPHIHDDLADLTADLHNHPLVGRCDAVISTEVVEHLLLPRVFVRNCAAFLKNNGRLIISTPYHGYLKNLALALFDKMDDHWNPLWDGGHIKFWSVKTLSGLMREAGFVDLQFQYAGRIRPFAKSMVAIASKPGPRPVT